MNKKTNKTALVPNNSFTEFLLYTTPIGKVKVEIFLRDENIWLTQEKIALLFGVDRSVVTKHLRNIFECNELSGDAVCAKIAHTAEDGKTYQTKFYNLDAIISVGYRVSSTQATHFRIWATERLKEYIIKARTVDDYRLKNHHDILARIASKSTRRGSISLSAMPSAGTRIAPASQLKPTTGSMVKTLDWPMCPHRSRAIEQY